MRRQAAPLAGETGAGAPSRHLPEIDALRGLAACGVAFFDHFFRLSGENDDGPLGSLPLAGWLYRDGWLLVDLFFVISGMIFAHVYLDQRTLRPRPGLTLRAFAVNRVARVYPLHVATLLVVAVLLMLAVPGHNPTTDRYLATADGYHFLLNLLMLQGADLAQGGSFNGPSWSLTSEALCYLLFIAVALLAPRRFTLAAALLTALALAASLLPDTTTETWRTVRGPLGFFAGCLLYRALPALRQVPAWLLVAALAAAAALVAGLDPWTRQKPPLYALLLFPLLVALSFRGALGWLLRSAPLQWLGRLSYSIYLIHTPVHVAMILLLGGTGLYTPDRWPVAFGVSIVLTLALSQLSYEYLEEPARRALRRFAQAAPGRARQPAE